MNVTLYRAQRRRFEWWRQQWQIQLNLKIAVAHFFAPFFDLLAEMVEYSGQVKPAGVSFSEVRRSKYA